MRQASLRCSWGWVVEVVEVIEPGHRASPSCGRRRASPVRTMTLLLLLVLFMIDLCQGNFDPKDFVSNDTFQELRRDWVRIERESYDYEERILRRSEHRDAVFKRVAGVYKDKAFARRKGLQKTILIGVISEENKRMRSIFSNYMCFCRHHSLDPLFYIVDREPSQTDAHPHDEYNYSKLRVQGDNISSPMTGYNTISFPSHLLWKTLLDADKKYLHKKRRHKVSYMGNSTNFATFGALVMVLPQLEVLTAGYDVIYFDLDLAFVLDPIDSIVRGSADFVVSTEERKCRGHSFQYMFFANNKMEFPQLFLHPKSEPEANTGVMFVRSTDAGLYLYRKWLYEIIRDNDENDQIKLRFAQLGALSSDSCNLRTSSIAGNMGSLLGASRKNGSSTSFAASYCMLSEYTVQTGMSGVHCPSGNRKYRGSWDEYVLAMRAFGARVYRNSSVYFSPVIMHVNYIGDKVRALSDRGLWLHKRTYRDPDDNATIIQCHKYDFLNTLYGKKNWTKEVDDVINSTKRDFDSRYPPQDIKALAMTNSKTVYLKDDLILRPFASLEVFQSSGLNFTDVKFINDAKDFGIFTLGQPIHASERFLGV